MLPKHIAPLRLVSNWLTSAFRTTVYAATVYAATRIDFAGKCFGWCFRVLGATLSVSRRLPRLERPVRYDPSGLAALARKIIDGRFAT
jgi:hypothetical protein